MSRDLPSAWNSSKLDIQVSNRICNCVGRGLSLTKACHEAGIATSTVYKWIRRGEKGERGYHGFLRALNHAKAKAELDAKNAIKAASDKGDWKASQVWLDILASVPDDFSSEANSALSEDEKIQLLLTVPAVKAKLKTLLAETTVPLATVVQETEEAVAEVVDDD